MDCATHILYFQGQPAMIAESTPFGGIVSWSEWFQPTLNLIHKYDMIKRMRQDTRNGVERVV